MTWDLDSKPFYLMLFLHIMHQTWDFTANCRNLKVVFPVKLHCVPFIEAIVSSNLQNSKEEISIATSVWKDQASFHSQNCRTIKSLTRKVPRGHSVQGFLASQEQNKQLKCFLVTDFQALTTRDQFNRSGWGQAPSTLCKIPRWLWYTARCQNMSPAQFLGLSFQCGWCCIFYQVFICHLVAVLILD